MLTIVRLSDIPLSGSRRWTNILIIILVPTFITVLFFLAPFSLGPNSSAFAATLPSVFAVAVLVPFTIISVITSRARKIPTAQPIAPPEAVICPPPSRREIPILGFAMGAEAIEIFHGKELVARWEWSTITDVSLGIECMGPVWHFAAVTIYRGEESDTLMALGALGIPSNTRTIVLADAIRRFSKDG